MPPLGASIRTVATIPLESNAISWVPAETPFNENAPDELVVVLCPDAETLTPATLPVTLFDTTLPFTNDFPVATMPLPLPDTEPPPPQAANPQEPPASKPNFRNRRFFLFIDQASV
jgi:hypothetical protein